MKPALETAPRSVTFTVPGTPCSTNALWRTDRGQTHLTDAARRWKADVALCARAAGLAPLQGRISVRLRYLYRAPGRRIDLDNVLKPLLDGLSPFFNDKQVVHLEALAVHDPRRPGVVVTVSPLDPVPLTLLDGDP